MADSVSEEQTDLSKMKVPELKKMLKARGLSMIGNKQELIDRLQSSEAAAEALLEGSEVGDTIDEELDRELDETLDDEPAKDVEESSPIKEDDEKIVETPPEPAKVEVPKSKETEKEVSKKEDPETLKNGTSTEQEAPQPKHKRITISDSSAVDDNDIAAKKKARLERFNQATEAKVEATNAKTVAKPDSVEVTTKTDNGTDKLKKRAERFGILSPAEQKKQQLEKLQARKARFASTAAPAPAAATPVVEKTTAVPLPAIKTASSVDEKKRLRAERFKIKS